MKFPKVMPPFSEQDKKDILAYSNYAVENKIKVDNKYTGLSHDEAIALILPTTNYDSDEAEFILAMARGELKTDIVDENGRNITITY